MQLESEVSVNTRIEGLFPLRRLPGHHPGRAAVMLLLTRGGYEAELVLTKRASHLRSHAGEVAFPGGKWEASDDDLAATALRESSEEVGLRLSSVELLATLPQTSTRQGVLVTPFVARLDSTAELQANPDELESVFTVPLKYLLSDPSIRTDVFMQDDREWRIPVFQYEGHTIWGFTAAVIVDFLNSVFAAGIGSNPDKPQRLIRY